VGDAGYFDIADFALRRPSAVTVSFRKLVALVLAEGDEWMTVREVQEALEVEGVVLEVAFVSVLLRRLYEKGSIERRRSRVFKYRATRTC
jgi:predicted transcriptional regulator of viral defense system